MKCMTHVQDQGSRVPWHIIIFTSTWTANIELHGVNNLISDWFRLIKECVYYPNAYSMSVVNK